MALKMAVPRIPKGVKPLNDKGERISERLMWETIMANLRLVMMVETEEGEREIRIYQLDRSGHKAAPVLFDKNLDLGTYRKLGPKREEEIEEFVLKALLYARTKKFATRTRFTRSHSFPREQEAKPQRHHRKLLPSQAQSKMF